MKMPRCSWIEGLDGGKDGPLEDWVEQIGQMRWRSTDEDGADWALEAELSRTDQVSRQLKFQIGYLLTFKRVKNCCFQTDLLCHRLACVL